MLAGMTPRAPRPLRRPFPLPAGRRPAFAAACASLCACMALAAPAPSPAQTVTLNRGGQDVRITVNDAATLPGDFPADIALPSTHTVVRVERSGNGTTVVIATPGTVDEEAARLRSAMPARGWAPGHVLQPRTGVAQAWVKDDRAVLAWLTPGEAGGVRVQLQLVPR